MNKSKCWIFSFKLTRKIGIQILENSSEIEFRYEVKKNQKYVTGFSIFSEKDQYVGQLEAFKIAERITDVLTIKSGLYTESKFQGYSSPVHDGLRTIHKGITLDVVISGKIEIKNEDIEKLFQLEDGSELDMLIFHLTTVIRAQEKRDPITMIRQLYLIFENDLKGYHSSHKNKKFYHLRHILSHKKPRKMNIEGIKSLGENYFDFTDDGRFDYRSEKNIRNLQKQADEFLQIGKEYISKFI